jgi:hypothetical protein
METSTLGVTGVGVSEDEREVPDVGALGLTRLGVPLPLPFLVFALDVAALVAD